jgi:para-nitrobenzyl esterase
MEATITAGRVRGHEVAHGVVELLGIPYARAPRFAPPGPAAAWSGVLEADSFGPASLQPPGDVFMAVELPQAEECLTLNVWTPACDGGARPVMVWIHGGGYRQGGGSHLLTGGPALPAHGDVVVVTLNYRLGALGFAAHPDLGRDGGPCGNWGLLDQLAALEWVRDNIDAFGGDPANVTIFGESAGGGSVALLLASASGRGLFQRAVVQSGAPKAASLETAAERTERLAAACGAASVRDLYAVPAEGVLAAQQELEGAGSMVFVPSIDGSLVADDPQEAIGRGAAAGVPTIVGTNAEEWRLMGFGDPQRADLTNERLLRRLRRTLGDGAEEVVDVFRREREARGEPATPADLWFAIESDRYFRVPALAFADAQSVHAPTWTYLFTYPSPALDGWLGPCHVLDVPFVFGVQGREDIAWFTGAGPDADRLAEAMMAAWTGLARHGAPATGELAWTQHDPLTRPTLRWDTEPVLVAAPREAERAVVAKWAGDRTGL